MIALTYAEIARVTGGALRTVGADTPESIVDGTGSPCLAWVSASLAGL